MERRATTAQDEEGTSNEFNTYQSTLDYWPTGAMQPPRSLNSIQVLAKHGTRDYNIQATSQDGTELANEILDVLGLPLDQFSSATKT